MLKIIQSGRVTTETGLFTICLQETVPVCCTSTPTMLQFEGCLNEVIFYSIFFSASGAFQPKWLFADVELGSLKEQLPKGKDIIMLVAEVNRCTYLLQRI